MGDTYENPDHEKIRKELEKAGANENTQKTGAIWIAAALRGIARPKTPANTKKTRDNIKKHIEEALSLFEKLDPLDRNWLERDVKQPLEKVRDLLTYMSISFPGGHRERKHAAFAKCLWRFFEHENLKISITEDSPFVSIYSICTSTSPTSDNETGKKALSRLFADHQQKERSPSEGDKAYREMLEYLTNAYKNEGGQNS